MRIGVATDAHQVASTVEVKMTFNWRSDAALGCMRNSCEVAKNSLALLAEGKNLTVKDVSRIMSFNK